MSMSERSVNATSSAPKRPVRWPMPSEMVMLGAIAVVILVLHVLAGSLLQPATRGPAVPLEDARASLID